MTLEQVLIASGEDILPMDKVYVYDIQGCTLYSNEFWRLLDDPFYSDLLKRQAVEMGWRIFYLLNNSQK